MFHSITEHPSLTVRQVQAAATFAFLRPCKYKPAPLHHLSSVAPHCFECHFMASVKRDPRAILSTPGTSGYRLSYKWVLRVVPHKLSDRVSFN